MSTWSSTSYKTSSPSSVETVNWFVSLISIDFILPSELSSILVAIISSTTPSSNSTVTISPLVKYLRDLSLLFFSTSASSSTSSSYSLPL